MDRIPKLKADIQKQASLVYSNLYRKDDKVNKFFMADTGSNYLDGKVGRISSYDAIRCCHSSTTKARPSFCGSSLRRTGAI